MKVDVPRYYVLVYIKHHNGLMHILGAIMAQREGKRYSRFKMYYQKNISSGTVVIKWYQRCGISMSSY